MSIIPLSKFYEQDQFQALPDHCTAYVEVNLEAVKKNYHLLDKYLGGSKCCPVVKANAYGLGQYPVTRALIEEGADVFFTASIDEAVSLRQAFPHITLYPMNGMIPGSEKLYIDYNIIPVLSSINQIQSWAMLSAKTGKKHSAAIHFDTGMSRTGLCKQSTKTLLNDLSVLKDINIKLVMSHLACAREHQNNKNQDQISIFKKIASYFPEAAHSLSASGGMFLDKDFQFNWARPGLALYGIHGTDKPDLPTLEPAVNLRAKLIQTRMVSPGDTVGYNANFKIVRPTKVGTLGIGYADGYVRALSNQGTVYFGNHKVPIIGFVTMDMCMVDLTDIPDEAASEGTWCYLMGNPTSLAEVAQSIGTIGHELLTGFGRRIPRVYR